MTRRLKDNLFQFTVKQFFDFWYFYILAFISLAIVHYTQSFLPEFAKELGEINSLSNLSEINISKYFFVAGAIIVFRTSSRFLYFLPARLLQKEVKMEFLKIIERTHPWRYLKYNDGDIFNTLHHDFNSIRALIGFAFLQVGNILIASLIFIPKIIAFNQDLILAFAPLFLSFLGFSFIMHYSSPYFRKTMDLKSDVQNFIIESYNGKRSIKNFLAEEHFVQKFEEVSKDELISFFKAGVGVAISMPLIKLGIGASFICGCYIIKLNNLGASAILYFSGFVFLFLEPLSMVSWIGGVFVRSNASWKRIKEFINGCEKVSEDERKMNEFFPRIRIEPEHYKFILPLRLSEINIDLFLNTSNVLIGETGVGKTFTLYNINYLLNSMNKKTTYVAQHPYLYNDTIENNIFLDKDVTPERKKNVIELINLFSLNDLASNAEAVLNLEVGENGKQVSGGQAQRICLIRSLLVEAEFILWDDPFCSIDVIQEEKIWNKLDNILINKTFILTTHRLTTVRNCNHLVYLNKLSNEEYGSDFKILHGSVSNMLKENNEVIEFFKAQMV
jgi:ATP-binding cassette, subfamily B, multidrug efflux pump